MVDADGLRQEWEHLSGGWITRMEDRSDLAREALLDDWMIRIIGDVNGRRVVDLGCGEGRFSRMLAERGAATVGVDLQPAFIDYAGKKASAAETYHLGDMQRLDALGDEQFDLAVSYISLVDVPDQDAAVREAFRVLARGGRFVVCNLSPMSTGWIEGGPWVRDDDGAKRHYVLDDYGTEGPRQVVLGPDERITNFHRMLSTTVNGFLDAGFVLTGIHEPIPTAEQLARLPDDDLVRVPIFIIYDLEKPKH